MEHVCFPPLDLSDQRPCIRLIELGLDDATEFIRCKFHVRPLHDQAFIALSYTWGPHRASIQIYLGGQEVLVRPNLYQALLAIRKRFVATSKRSKVRRNLSSGWPKIPIGKSTLAPSKYSAYGYPYLDDELANASTAPLIWVDQLCINQADVEERNAQVALMASIYSQAKMVLVWLGTHPEPAVVRDTIACLEQTNVAVRRKKKHKHWTYPTDLQRKVMEEIAGNRYWTRLWIVQELMLAQKALIQLDEVVFEYQELLPLFETGSGNVKSNQTFAHGSFRQWKTDGTPMGQLLWLRATLRDLDAAGSDLTLHMMLTFTKEQRCSDLRDKIFGLLGLVRARSASRDNQVSVAADYTLDTIGVYDLVMHSAMNQHFSTATSALDFCRKASAALGVDAKNERFVRTTAEFLMKAIGRGIGPWIGQPLSSIDISLVEAYVRNCRWET